MPEPFLELAGISKSYPGVTALNQVSLSIALGEVVGLIGENGAGKSTLMKILGGVVSPSSGTIRLDGRSLDALTVRDSLAGGIAFVHQELNLFENLDVAANVFIGREPLTGGPLRLVDRKTIYARTAPLLKRLGADFAPTTLVSQLSLAERQLVEIAKALSLEAKIVILDEPTSSLTLSETARLLKVVGELKRSGVGIIFISHRLNEIEECADRVVVLRDGQMVGALSRAEINHDGMIRLMIGRDLRALYTPPAAPPGEAALELIDIRTIANPRKTVTLSLRRGEILGLAGLVGAGRTELARAIFGIDAPLGGSIRLDGKQISIGSPRDAIEQGIFLIPEDRKRSGLLLDVSIADNVSLPDLGSYSTAAIVNEAAVHQNAERQRQRLRIKAPNVDAIAGSLSGGNQQKIVLAKWLSMKPRVIIFDEPTRGIDVGAKTEIYELMRRLADSGVATLMISSDMEEVIGVSDRMAVMHEGAISGFLERGQFSEQNVLQLAIGQSLH